MIVHVRMFVCLSVCLSVCLFSKHVSGRSYTVENASSATLIPSLPEMKPGLAAIGSATVAVLSQSSGIERPFFAMRRGHVGYSNCALYMLLYKQQCRGFYNCSKDSRSAMRSLCSRNTVFAEISSGRKLRTITILL